jgi:hypothetical protein
MLRAQFSQLDAVGHDSAFLAIFHCIGIAPPPIPLADCGVYSILNDAKFKRIVSLDKPSPSTP